MGIYTYILNIIAPSSAVPGEQVTVEVQVQCISANGAVVTTTGKVNNTSIYFGSIAYRMSYGTTVTFRETITMLSGGVAVHVWTWIQLTDGSWQEDDNGSVVIADGEALPGEYPTSDIAEFDLLIPAHTYDMGGQVLFTGTYKHKGVAIAGTLTISLGTGIYPSFSAVHTFDPIPVSFSASQDWEAGNLSGSIVLPSTLTPGQTYSVRATLRTDDGAQEIDTDWGIITIGEIAPELEIMGVNITPVGKGHILTDPASEEGKTQWYDGDTGGFPYGTNVEVTAVPLSGYVFEKWSDEIVGGVSYSNPAYVQPMTEHRGVKAHFITEGEEPEVPLDLSGLNVIDYYKKV